MSSATLAIVSYPVVAASLKISMAVVLAIEAASKPVDIETLATSDVCDISNIAASDAIARFCRASWASSVPANIPLLIAAAASSADVPISISFWRVRASS